MRKRLIPLCLALLLALPALAGATFADETFPAGEQETYFVPPDAPEPGASQPGSPENADSPREDPWPRTIVVTVGGDCTLGTTDAQRKRDDGFDAVVRDKGYAWPFSGLVSLFTADDLTLVNFEGTLTDATQKTQKLFNFKGPAEYAQILTLGSVEAVNLANNHFHEYGEKGKADTLDALTAAGIVCSMGGRPAIYETRGVKIGLIGNTFAYKNGKCDFSKDVKALREAGCQIVIASFHWGSEGKNAFTGEQKSIGRAAIKAGADVVVGHHPHVIQGIEQYEGRYILYSLANLVFGGNLDPTDRDTYVAQLTFVVQENGETSAPTLRIYPARLTEYKKGTDYRPVLVTSGETYERILNKILSRSVNMKNFTNIIE